MRTKFLIRNSSFDTSQRGKYPFLSLERYHSSLGNKLDELTNFNLKYIFDFADKLKHYWKQFRQLLTEFNVLKGTVNFILCDLPCPIHNGTLQYCRFLGLKVFDYDNSIRFCWCRNAKVASAEKLHLKIILTKNYKHFYLFYTWLDKALKDTVFYYALHTLNVDCKVTYAYSPF